MSRMMWDWGPYGYTSQDKRFEIRSPYADRPFELTDVETKAITHHKSLTAAKAKARQIVRREQEATCKS